MSAPAKAVQEISSLDLAALRRLNFEQLERLFLDGQPSFLLDYFGPGNPPFIRSIVDEVREVAPGLYLGRAALLVSGKPRPILFFAVSFQ